MRGGAEGRTPVVCCVEVVGEGGGWGQGLGACRSLRIRLARW